MRHRLGGVQISHDITAEDPGGNLEDFRWQSSSRRLRLFLLFVAVESTSDVAQDEFACSLAAAAATSVSCSQCQPGITPATSRARPGLVVSEKGTRWLQLWIGFQAYAAFLDAILSWGLLQASME